MDEHSLRRPWCPAFEHHESRGSRNASLPAEQRRASPRDWECMRGMCVRRISSERSDHMAAFEEQEGFHSGVKSSARQILFVLVSVLAWALAAFAAVIVFGSHNLASLEGIERYALPIYQIIPWLAGLSCLRATRKSLSSGRINEGAADFCSGVIVALLSASYVALAAFEITFALAWKASVA